MKAATHLETPGPVLLHQIGALDHQNGNMITIGGIGQREVLVGIAISVINLWMKTTSLHKTPDSNLVLQIMDLRQEKIPSNLKIKTLRG
jgi:hypothetical protein